MKKYLLYLLCAVVAASPAFAASKKKTPPPLIITPVISSVTPTSVTITEGKNAKTLGITQFTEINVNGQKAMASDLKPGMNVTVTLGTDPTKASRIVATGK